MGEAMRRGSAAERRRLAIRRNKDLIVRERGGADERGQALLRAGLQPFLDRMSADQWHRRRKTILDQLRARPAQTDLEKATSVRVREDEIGWYLFLCQQALEDPMCTDISQAQRALPFFAGIGARWQHAPKVRGLARKLDELLGDYKKEPDGLIFEILVALSYAACGWEVELLAEQPTKTPDMVARRGDDELYIECKRMCRRTQYAETERNEFLRLWDRAKHVLLGNRQWIWLKGTFHADASELPTEFLSEVLQSALPLGSGEVLIHDSPLATIRARLMDREAVQRHMAKYRVKANSPMLSRVLGGDWAPENAAVTIIHAVKTSQVVDCELPVLGAYIEEIGFACGFTREFDSAISIEKKARDVTKQLSDAVKQVPDDKPSIIHIAAETMEGLDVERRRTEKVMRKIPQFVSDKPVLAVYFHRLQTHQRAEKLYEVDETVDRFQVDGVRLRHIPSAMVVPLDTPMQSGSHWEMDS